MRKTSLGLPGDLLAAGEGRIPDQWRIGGQPALPAGVQIGAEHLKCGTCMQQTSFVAQVGSFDYLHELVLTVSSIYISIWYFTKHMHQ